MDYIDVTEAEMAEVDVKGRMALFKELRVNQGTVPEGMYCYALRHEDDFGLPCTIEKSVVVDYFGAVITTEPLDFGDKDYIFVGYDDFGFTGEHLSIAQYAEKMEKFKAEGTFEYHGFHYVPVRKFNQEEKDMSLKDISVYLRDTQGTRAGTVAYDCHESYAVSGNSEADIFLCVETGKEYILCEKGLQEYTKGYAARKGQLR